ncbi:hypothetical protein [Vagococcus xieshaowenii]|uniref:Uncharacterized protein n=1 Tax=Vagococcus xieshaowenii TaxID=2562451 RepID=A0ABX5TDG9_9ENTE|nr:hypothetical protein [Vagococcus xieshaowenii]QCA28077.1 hypothetical protein E4Z98_01655 [Vagococcus xieshaowenii]
MDNNKEVITSGLKEIEELIEKAKNLVKDGTIDEAQSQITGYLKDLGGQAEELINKVKETTPELVDALDGIFNKEEAQEATDTVLEKKNR